MKRIYLIAAVILAMAVGHGLAQTAGTNSLQATLYNLFCPACDRPSNQNMRDLIASIVTLRDTQTITGDKTYTGAMTFGSVAGTNETITNLTATTSNFLGASNFVGTANFTRANFLTQVLVNASPTQWDMSLGPIASVTIAGASTAINNPSNMPNGGRAVLRLAYASGAVGSWGAAYKWAGTAPTLSSIAGRIDVVLCDILDGATLQCSALVNQK